MRTGPATVERSGRSAIVHLHGDLVVEGARRLFTVLRSVGRRRDVKHLLLDFHDAGKVDSSTIAIVSLVGKQLARHGKRLEIGELVDERHRAAFELLPKGVEQPLAPEEKPSALEKLGDALWQLGVSGRALFAMIADIGRQGFAVARRRKRLPAGALATQINAMGVDAVFIVGLLSFLLGMTTAFQGAVALQRFGAGVFVADVIGLSMVREFAPLMTAIILTGRTGAAIAAELGTMQMRSEVDALTAMGINPVRFLIVPRLLAITLVVPALTLMAMFIGMLGGMVVTSTTLDMPAVTFWSRMAERVDLMDYIHGIGKSFVFAWIIGLTGCHMGMRAGKDASAVGAATTRTVVTSIFFIIVVDAVFATISTLTGSP